MATKRPPLDTGEPLANARHERFAQLVVSGLPQSRAYIEAGYQGSDSAARANAARLIANDNIARRIDALRAPARAVVAEQAEAAAGSAAWIASMAVEGVNRAYNVVPVYEMRNGRRVQVEGEWTCDLRAAAPFLNLLAKQHIEFSDKHEVTGDLRLRVEALAAVAHMTPEQLRTLAEQARTGE